MNSITYVLTCVTNSIPVAFYSLSTHLNKTIPCFVSVKNNPPGKDLTKEDSERMIVGMLVNGLIEPVYRFTSYT
jgi:hypothetical protein